MISQLVLVRADLGKPLRRLAVGARDGVIFIAAEESLERIATGESIAIGFPISDVFEFDADVYERIKNGEADWNDARPAKISGIWKINKCQLGT